MIPAASLKSRITAFSFPAERFDALLKASKDHGVSLHAAVVAAAHFALAATAQNPYISSVGGSAVFPVSFLVY